MKTKKATATLDDRYRQASGRVFVTGAQALVRLALDRRRLDAAADRQTAGYITGYRGSPLGNFDNALWQAQSYLDENHLKFQAGVNEDMAVTALWGTQQVGTLGTSDYDGVFGMFYGKTPGVDRSGDALKHANMAGTALFGGVLALGGDDHAAKSSTVAAQSEQTFIAAMIPVLSPANVQEIVDFGIAGFALSRYAGLWVALKCQTEIVESAAAIEVGLDRHQFADPPSDARPEDGVNYRWFDWAPQQDARMMNHKLPAALAFARVNPFDWVTRGGAGARLGLVAHGKAWSDLVQALDMLGIDDDAASELGLSVYKVGLTWPLEADGLSAFADGLETLLVIEEKRPLLEDQIARALFNRPEGRRPRLFGKDALGLPRHGLLDPLTIARALEPFVREMAPDHPALAVLTRLMARLSGANAPAAPQQRMAWFCSGCPHSSSTHVPEGSRALSGIGCHTLSNRSGLRKIPERDPR